MAHKSCPSCGKGYATGGPYGKHVPNCGRGMSRNAIVSGGRERPRASGPRVMPGYVYRLTEGTWRSAPNDAWDTEVIGDELEDADHVGERAIDGVRCRVFELKMADGEHEHYAQTFAATGGG